MDHASWNAYEGQIPPMNPTGAQGQPVSTGGSSEPFYPPHSATLGPVGTFQRFVPSLNASTIMPLRLPSVTARKPPNLSPASSPAHCSPQPPHFPSSTPLSFVPHLPSTQTTGFGASNAIQSPLQTPKFSPTNFPAYAVSPSLSLPFSLRSPQTDTIKQSNVQPPSFDSEKAIHTPKDLLVRFPLPSFSIPAPRSVLSPPQTISPFSSPSITSTSLPSNVEPTLPPLPRNDTDAANAQVSPTNGFMVCDVDVENSTRISLEQSQTIPSSKATPRLQEDNRPSDQPQKSKTGRFGKIERPSTNLFSSIAFSTTPEISQLLQSITTRPSPKTPENDASASEIGDFRHKIVMEEITPEKHMMDVDEERMPLVELIEVNAHSEPMEEVHMNVEDMEIEGPEVVDGDIIIVGDSFLPHLQQPSIIKDALNTIDQLLMMTEDDPLSLLEHSDPCYSESTGIDVATEILPFSSAPSEEICHVGCLPTEKAHFDPLQFFFEAVSSMAFGFQSFRADFRFLVFRTDTPSIIHPIPSEPLHMTKAIEHTFPREPHSKITNIEVLEEEEELPNSPPCVIPTALHPLPPSIPFFDAEESFSESITMENMLDCSESTIYNQSQDLELSTTPLPPLLKLQQEAMEWSLMPRTETCPWGVGFVVALLTSPRPLGKQRSDSHVRANPAPSEPISIDTTKKKRRATLHPNILAPTAKKSKQVERADSFW